MSTFLRQKGLKIVEKMDVGVKKLWNGRGSGQKLGKLVTSFMDGPYHGTSSNLQYNKCRFFFCDFWVNREYVCLLYTLFKMEFLCERMFDN